MNGFLEDLKGSFGILSNADVMSYLLRGLMFTLVISVIAIVFSLLLGVALALARNYCMRGPARVLQKMASIYIELFRNTPLMLWMFVCFVMCPAPAVSKSFAEMLKYSPKIHHLSVYVFLIKNNRGTGLFPIPLKNMPLSHVGIQGTFNYSIC